MTLKEIENKRNEMFGKIENLRNAYEAAESFEDMEKLNFEQSKIQNILYTLTMEFELYQSIKIATETFPDA